MEQLMIFSKTGIVYFTALWQAIRGDPVAELISRVLFADRGGSSFDSGEYTLKWSVSNTADIVVCIVLDKLLADRIKYVDPLLETVRDAFVSKYGEMLATVKPAPNGSAADADSEYSLPVDVFGFGGLFELCLQKSEEKTNEKGRPSHGKPGTPAQLVKQTSKDTPQSSPSISKLADSPALRASSSKDSAGSHDIDDDVVAENRRKLLEARNKPTKKPLRTDSNSNTPKTLSSLATFDYSYSEEAAKKLNKANAAEGAESTVEKVEFKHDHSSGADLDDSDRDLIEKLSTTAASGAGAPASDSTFSSWFSKTRVGSFLATVTGNKVLDADDLAPILEKLKTQLISKNVAREIADTLCENVAKSCVGKRLEATGSVAATMEAALRESIQKILTPSRTVDVLAEVRAKKESSGEPYVIVFVGVNGVGKSTSLSKVAYHLKDNHHSVLIAACDSFRAGAVEQLKRHCQALDIPLFTQGYGKDPVVIASGAITEAFKKSMDVVLVDTAGRMQNNAPLMTQIAKVVAINKPDLVLFVGEALVGNDGVDQLVEFDRALVDYAVDSSEPRKIDGILLTKFDTIDDKVGAALSMVYKTGIPIVFLGTGQKYPDLKKLNIGAVVKALLA